MIIFSLSFIIYFLFTEKLSDKNIVNFRYSDKSSSSIVHVFYQTYMRSKVKDSFQNWLYDMLITGERFWQPISFIRKRLCLANK